MGVNLNAYPLYCGLFELFFCGCSCVLQRLHSKQRWIGTKRLWRILPLLSPFLSFLCQPETPEIAPAGTLPPVSSFSCTPSILKLQARCCFLLCFVDCFCQACLSRFQLET